MLLGRTCVKRALEEIMNKNYRRQSFYKKLTSSSSASVDQLLEVDLFQIPKNHFTPRI